MKRILVALLSVIMISINSQAQSITDIRQKVIELQKQKMEQKSQNANDTSNAIEQPQENIKVTREYDENGNLIRYDSTYSYYYSSSGQFKNQEEAMKYFEELKSKMMEDFNFPYFLSIDDLFNDEEEFYSNFFDDEYFDKLHERQNKFIESQLELINKLFKENITDNPYKNEENKEPEIKGKLY